MPEIEEEVSGVNYDELEVNIIETIAVIGAITSTRAIKEFIDSTTFSITDEYKRPLPFEMVRVFFCGDHGDQEYDGPFYCIHGQWEVYAGLETIDAGRIYVGLYNDKDRSWEYI
jgi:flavodoxin